MQKKSTVSTMLDERQSTSGTAAPQCGFCFSRHKSVVIIAALGCSDPRMAPKNLKRLKG